MKNPMIEFFDYLCYYNIRTFVLCQVILFRNEYEFSKGFAAW
jgi:hypothetical protein